MFYIYKNNIYYARQNGKYILIFTGMLFKLKFLANFKRIHALQLIMDMILFIEKSNSL